MSGDSNIKFIQAIISFIALTGMKVPTVLEKEIYITCVLILILMITSFSEHQYKNEIKYVIWWYCQLERSLERQRIPHAFGGRWIHQYASSDYLTLLCTVRNEPGWVLPFWVKKKWILLFRVYKLMSGKYHYWFL